MLPPDQSSVATTIRGNVEEICHPTLKITYVMLPWGIIGEGSTRVVYTKFAETLAGIIVNPRLN